MEQKFKKVGLIFLSILQLKSGPSLVLGAEDATSLPESRIDLFNAEKLKLLESKLEIMVYRLEHLSVTLDKQSKLINQSIAELKMDKTIAAIQMGDQVKAQKFWNETVAHTAESEVHANLQKVITAAYANTRGIFYRILEFILKNKLNSGFPLLYNELAKGDHVEDGGEIFVLAKSLDKVCGRMSTLYKSLPKIVQDIVEGPVVLQSEFNHGYVVAQDRQNCTKVSYYECSEAHPKQEVFIHKVSNMDEESEHILIDARAQWEFILPEKTEDLPLSSGFLLKNVHSGEFLIVKLRGASTIFMRKNTTFDSYYAKDRQCQFVPQIDRMKGEWTIKIGMRHKHVNETDFFFGGVFDKVKVLPLIKRFFVAEKDEFFWNIIPLHGEMESNKPSAFYPIDCIF